MKKFLLAALMAGVATSAFAADLPNRKGPPPAPAPIYAPVFSWTGFYVGLNGGYGLGTGSSAGFGNPSGGLIGGTAGYNYQIGQFVVGAEGDWDWADLTKSGTNSVGAYNSKVDSIVTARARAGFAIDRTLLFVTGGYAGVDEKLSFPGLPASETNWRSGGVIGAGAEYAITNNITAKAEYLYAPLGKSNFQGVKDDTNLSLFRAGLNYKF